MHQKRRTYECYDIFYLKALDAMVEKLILKNLKKCPNSPPFTVQPTGFELVVTNCFAKNPRLKTTLVIFAI